MSKVVAIRRGDNGAIAQYKLDDGRVLGHHEICDAAIRGEIEGISTFTTRDGGEAVRSDRGQYDYSLSKLPEF
jgi:hypothetical protein